jgi:hypothetical protein
LEKVVVFVTLRTKKLSLLFLDFSTIFNRFLKFQPNTPMLKESFCNQDFKKIKTLQLYPQFAQNPLERVSPSQCGPWAMGRRG